MRRSFHWVVCSLIFVSALARGDDPDFQTIFTRLNPGIPTSIQLRGRMRWLSLTEKRKLHAGLTHAVELVRDLAPAWQKTHLFRYFPPPLARGRKFTLILTDRPFTLPTSEVIGEASHGLTTAIFQTENDLTQEFFLVIRVDQLLFKRNGSYRDEAFADFVEALLVEIYGSASVQMEGTVKQLAFYTEADRKARIEKGWRRKIRLLTELLMEPQVVDLEAWRPSLFRRLTEACDQLSRLTGKFEGPWAVPTVIRTGALTDHYLSPELSEEVQSTLARALTLLRALPPAGRPNNLFRSNLSHWANWQDRVRLTLRCVDSRDSVECQKHGSNLSTALFLPSELCALPSPPSVSRLSEALWLDRTIYTPDFNLRPERLAATAMALAGDFYNHLQAHLDDPEYAEPEDKVGILKRFAANLGEGLAFADRLQADEKLWADLTETEQEGFQSIRGAFGAWWSKACQALLEAEGKDVPQKPGD